MKEYERNPIVISGPSGSGKSKLIDYVETKYPTFKEAIGMTTRERRPLEIEKMNFVTIEDFKEAIKKNELIEYCIYNNNYYGVSKNEFKKLAEYNIIFNVGYSSAKEIQKIYSGTHMIYLLPPTKEELLRRLGDRGYERYIAGINETVNNALKYDYLLISLTDDIEKTSSDFMDIVSQNSNGKQKRLVYAKNKDFIKHFYE